MSITTVSSRTFNQDTSRVKKAAADGPVFITDRGKTSYVLLSIAEYERMKGPQKTIGELLYMPGAEDIKLEIPPRSDFARGADFS